MGRVEIIPRMDEKDYRARPERSQSDFKKFLEPTPAHAKWAIDNPMPASGAMDLGTCLHAEILVGRTVYAVEPVADGRTTAGKAIKAAFALENAGKIILSAANGAIVRGMVAGIRRNSGIMAVLESTLEREVSVFWDGKKARLDGVFPLGVFDLKTCRGADFRNFSKAIFDYRLDIQAAHYLEAAAAAAFPADDFFFLSVENFPPYEAALYKLDHDSLEIGRRELERLRGIYWRCFETGEYPGYSPDALTIGLPEWKIRKELE